MSPNRRYKKPVYRPSLAGVATVCIFWMLVGLAIWALVYAFGCGHVALVPPDGHGGGFKSPPGTEPIIVALNLVAWGGVLLAFAALVLSAWLPIPKTTAGLLLIGAIGAWALKVLLVKLWWLIILVGVAIAAGFVWHLLGGTALHMQGKRGWLVWSLERWSKRDINQDGVIGAPNP